MTLDLFDTEIPAPQTKRLLLRPTASHDEWLTPPDLLARLGQFDTDPCSPITRPWRTAAQHWTIEDDGLRQPWTGFVWLNPPFSQAARWLARLAQHQPGGLALLHGRTETAVWFDHVWPDITGALFVRGRLHFHRVDGSRAAANSGAPCVLLAYGDPALQRLRDVRDLGALVIPDPEQVRDLHPMTSGAIPASVTPAQPGRGHTREETPL